MGRWVDRPAYKAAVDVIVAARKERGLTQRDVAARLGKPPSFIGKVEKCERSIDVIEFVAFARAIGIDESRLFGDLLAALPERLDD
jgi:transcriptional regulator with XRE-family HTH domain